MLRSLERECDSFHDHFSTLLDSDNGGGSQSMSAPVEAPSLKTPDERRLDGVRVLYAEDNAFCVKVIKTYLKSCNASVTSARDGTDVVSKLSRVFCRRQHRARGQGIAAGVNAPPRSLGRRAELRRQQRER